MNQPRLTTRSRKEVTRVEDIVLMAIEDYVITPAEREDIRDGFLGAKALATIVDINDSRGRATSLVQVKALNDEFEAWLERLPETA